MRQTIYDMLAGQGALRLKAKQRRIERAAELQARKVHSELNTRLAEALGTSVRYVRMLRNEGTTLPETAKIMAIILGGKPETYMRPARRRGRRADLVAWFMKVQADGCSFTDFIADPPEDHLEGDAHNMIAVLQVRGAADFQSLETLIAFVSALDFESVSVESAATVWRAFKIWRIDRIATLARFTADEGAELI
jgi:hypothetical protein